MATWPGRGYTGCFKLTGLYSIQSLSNGLCALGRKCSNGSVAQDVFALWADKGARRQVGNLPPAAWIKLEEARDATGNKEILSTSLHSAPCCEGVEVVTTRVGKLRELTTTLVEPTSKEHTLSGVGLQPHICPGVGTPGCPVTERFGKNLCPPKGRDHRVQPEEFKDVVCGPTTLGMGERTHAKDPPPYWIIILARGADSGMSRGLILALSPRTALSLDSPRMHIPGASAAVLCGRPISTQSLPCGYRETTQMRVWREFTQRCPGMSSGSPLFAFWCVIRVSQRASVLTASRTYPCQCRRKECQASGTENAGRDLPKGDADRLRASRVWRAACKQWIIDLQVRRGYCAAGDLGGQRASSGACVTPCPSRVACRVRCFHSVCAALPPRTRGPLRSPRADSASSRLISDVARETRTVSARRTSDGFFRAGLVQGYAACDDRARAARRVIRAGSVRALTRARRRVLLALRAARGIGTLNLSLPTPLRGVSGVGHRACGAGITVHSIFCMSAAGGFVVLAGSGCTALPLRTGHSDLRAPTTQVPGVSPHLIGDVASEMQNVSGSFRGVRRASAGVATGLGEARRQSIDAGGVRVVNTRVRSRDAAAWAGVMGRERADRRGCSAAQSVCTHRVRRSSKGTTSATPVILHMSLCRPRPTRLPSWHRPHAAESNPPRAGTTSCSRTQGSCAVHGRSPGSDAGARAALRARCQADDCPRRAWGTQDRTRVRTRLAVCGFSVQGCTPGPMGDDAAATREKPRRARPGGDARSSDVAEGYASGCVRKRGRKYIYKEGQRWVEGPSPLGRQSVAIDGYVRWPMLESPEGPQRMAEDAVATDKTCGRALWSVRAGGVRWAVQLHGLGENEHDTSMRGVRDCSSGVSDGEGGRWDGHSAWREKRTGARLREQHGCP
ncbi:predicted protein [Postia placenta Mad-698-R]|nr:predicted protein [Postia placenta Mad-698-R]